VPEIVDAGLEVWVSFMVDKITSNQQKRKMGGGKMVAPSHQMRGRGGKKVGGKIEGKRV